MIKVLVVDDHEMFSEALGVMLRREPDLALLGDAGDAEEAVRICLEEHPDVVLMDLDLPDMDGVEATRRIREASQVTKVVVLTALESPSLVAATLAAGACGYVPKTMAAEKLLDGIRRAAAGELVMPEQDLAAVVGELRNARRAPLTELAIKRLTPRETQILRSIASGETAAQIAERLGISALTVHTHVKSIMAKLGVHSKIEAVTLAWRYGLAEPASRTA